MWCEEHIKSYFYYKRNPGLCYKANMLQTPCSVFPEKHSRAVGDPLAPRHGRTVLGHRLTLPPGESPRPRERSLHPLRPERHGDHKSLQTATSLPQCHCCGTLQGSPPANPFSELSSTHFHVAGSTSWASTSQLAGKLPPLFTRSVCCLLISRARRGRQRGQRENSFSCARHLPISRQSLFVEQSKPQRRLLEENHTRAFFQGDFILFGLLFS